MQRMFTVRLHSMCKGCVHKPDKVPQRVKLTHAGLSQPPWPDAGPPPVLPGRAHKGNPTIPRMNTGSFALVPHTRAVPDPNRVIPRTSRS